MLLDNGDLVLAAFATKAGVDLTAIGGPKGATIGTQILQQISPSGGLVWSWDPADHIPAAEMDPQWFANFIVAGKPPYDIYHWNSVEMTPTLAIISMRHSDAIYAIDRATGAIVWKLGGTKRPESLTILGDPVFPASGFGGQHDARLLADGSLTLHDNGTGRNRSPRVVRYALVPPQPGSGQPGTATLVEERVDAKVSDSVCCGSARKLAKGQWLVGWGGTGTIWEVDAAGAEVRRVVWQQGTLIYRAEPVATGLLDRAVLRAGMDAQVP